MGSSDTINAVTFLDRTHSPKQPPDSLPVGGVRSTSEDAFTLATPVPQATTGDLNLSQNPRAYQDILPPHAAQILDEARQLTRWRKERFEQGTGFAMTQMGRDGLPVLNGAEIPKAFFNSKASQAADIEQFGKALPGNDEAWQALRS